MPVWRFGDRKPHAKVAIVTIVLLLSGVAILVVALTTIDRVNQPVAKTKGAIVPARNALLDVQRGLSDTQTQFIAEITQPNQTQRVLDIQKLRDKLTDTHKAWDEFKSSSLGQPGEQELLDRYDALMAEFERLEGPIGLLLIEAPDPQAMINDPNVARVREVQAGLLDVVNELDTRFYRPQQQQQVQAATDEASDGKRNLLIAFLLVMALSLPLAVVAYRSSRRTEHARRDDQARRAEEARRSRLEAQLNRAFEMAASEEAAYKIVGQALGENLPEHQPAELLIADSSIAHFRQVLTTDQAEHGPGCAVVAPSDCPASHRGVTLVFAHSKELDSCPYLRDRPGDPCSAVCQPVSIAGKSIGVIHTTMSEGLPPSDRLMVDVDLIARRAGERIGMLRAFAESESQARTDPLTGLLNRRSLENSTRRLVQDGARYCIAYGDLDYFKKLNDTFGHDVGDRALRTFAKALRDSIRPNDLACRYGGEEFVLVLPECEVEEAVTVVERVRSGLADVLLGGRLPPFTVSFGVAASTQADTFDRVVALADEALMRAKAGGRDRVLVFGQGPAELPPGSTASSAGTATATLERPELPPGPF